MMARVNYGKPYIFPGQRKGLWEGDVLLDHIVQVGLQSQCFILILQTSSKRIQENWEHIALPMEGPWVMGLEGWHQIGPSNSNSSLPRGPKMLRGLFLFWPQPMMMFRLLQPQ